MFISPGILFVQWFMEALQIVAFWGEGGQEKDVAIMASNACRLANWLVWDFGALFGNC